jgi:hypothetical protein
MAAGRRIERRRHVAAHFASRPFPVVASLDAPAVSTRGTAASSMRV